LRHQPFDAAIRLGRAHEPDDLGREAPVCYAPNIYHQAANRFTSLGRVSLRLWLRQR